MPIEWTIKRANDAVQTFTEASIVNAQLTRRNQAADVCEIAFGFGALKQADPWDADEQITIRRDGVRWFKGRNVGMRPGATGSAVSAVLTLAGVWYWLENIVFTRNARFVSDPDSNPTPTGSTLTIDDFETESKSCSVIFLGEASNGAKIASDAMITKALEVAIAKGAPFQIGTIDAGVDIPRQELRAATCADIIRDSLKWTPGQATFIDYSTTPPTFHCRRRNNRPTITIDAADEAIEEIALQERRDLVLSGVRIEYLRTHERADFSFRTLDVDEVGTPAAVQGVTIPIELYGSYLNGGAVVAAEPVPEGVAQSIFDAYDTAPFDGIVRLAKQELDDVLWTGKTLAVAGTQAQWENMAADIQSSREDTASGRVELALGPPNHLGPQDLVALLRNGANRNPGITANLLSHGGGTPTPNTIPPDSQDPRLEFDLNNPPDITLAFHQKSVEAGHFFPDRYFVIESDGDTVAGGISPGSLTVGATATDTYGIIVGRGSDRSDVPPADDLAAGVAHVRRTITVTLAADGSIAGVSTVIG